MTITRCRVNNLTNPIGYELGDKLCFSRIIENEEDLSVSERLIVSTDEEFSSSVYDSGITKCKGRARTVELSLSPRSRYFWKIIVFDEAGKELAESSVQYFETAKMQEPWAGRWIVPVKPARHPRIYKRIILNGNPQTARMYICGLGLYQLKINGKNADDSLFNPHFTSYDKWIEYQTYDVTPLLRAGVNEIEVLLGKGWYMGGFGLSGKENFYGDRFALLAELHVTVAGEEFVVGTDTTWQAELSEITESGIYYGEDVDMSLPRKKTELVYSDLHAGKLSASRSLPVRIKKILKAEIITCPSGEKLLDFKQNAVGFIRMKADVPCGTEIRMEFAEILQGGEFYRENYRSARSEFRYVSDGKPRVIAPHFTYFGFRYVRVSGVECLNANDFELCVIYSDFEKRGSIVTSNDKINRLIANAEWGIRGNSLDLPTDCPQRNERMGWTGDCQGICRTALYSFDMQSFYDKWLYEAALAQKEDGTVPDVIPPADYGGHDAAAWADAVAIVPWHTYLMDGDINLLRRQYCSMKKWVEHLRSMELPSVHVLASRNTREYGDWLALDHPRGAIDPDCPDGFTSFELLDNAYYAYSAEIVGKAAKALGYGEDAEAYAALAKNVKQEIWERYLKEPTPKTSTQTAYAVGLGMGIVPQTCRSKFAEKMREKFRADGDVLKTGFVGTIFAPDVLMDYGYEELAINLLLREEYPGWLYCVNLGATTIWERWNSLMPDGSANKGGMNSYNHYAYGMIVGWIYARLAGIRPVETLPGFVRAVIEPYASIKLPKLSAVLNTAAGRYESGYTVTKEWVEYRVRVPFGCTAKIVLKNADVSQVIGKTAKLQFESCNEGCCAEVGAGSYVFRKMM